MIEVDLVAVLIEVFVEEDLLISVDPVGWSSGRMDGWWLMGFADVVQDLVDGGGLGNERDDAHRRPTDGAGEWEGLIDAGDEHGPQVGVRRASRGFGWIRSVCGRRRVGR